MEKREQLYEGKAKKVFATDDPDIVIVDYKDDATAFNGVKKGTITIMITDLGDGMVDVFYDDSIVIIQDDGTEEGMYSGGYFISNTEFAEKSLTAPENLIDGEHKVKKAYDRIMRFTTIENLKEHYNQALEICKQLNE